MTNVTISNHRRFLAAAALPLLLLGCNIGCANKPADLRLTSLESKAQFKQQFSHAYVSDGAGQDGNTEIVLVNEAADATSTADAIPAAAGGTPRPTAAGVRQVMHVKVLWRPQAGTKQGHPSYTNAALKWYVFCDSPEGAAAAGGPNVLEYTGAGFVALSESALGTQVNIRNATLKPVASPGCTLNDPIGPAKLTGTFTATRSPERVSELLTELDAATQRGPQRASVSAR
jgi:hypothetical protein